MAPRCWERAPSTTSDSALGPCWLQCPDYPKDGVIGLPACGQLKILGAALQADGETRSVNTASSIRRRRAAWTILLDWTFRSRRRASALWMTQARSFGK